MSSKEQSAGLKDAAAKLESLPAMPVVVQRILGLQLDTDEGERELLKLIQMDPQISAKIVGLANTPLFGASKRVTSVSDAAIMLGLTRVKSVAVGIAVMSTLTRQPMGKLNLQNLWLHSLGVALAMRVLTRAMPSRTRPLEDEIFLAGLLHDIGFMVLNFIDPASSDELQARLVDSPDKSVGEIEAELSDIGHAELGAALVERWDLPDEIVKVVRYHHRPDAPEAEAAQPLVSLVNMAERLLPAFGIAEHVMQAVTEEDWTSLGIDPARAEELVDAIGLQLDQAKQMAASFG